MVLTGDPYQIDNPYVDSGSNAELVGEAGFAFRERGEIPALLDRLVGDYEPRQRAIRAPELSVVTDQYLQTLGLERHARAVPA